MLRKYNLRIQRIKAIHLQGLNIWYKLYIKIIQPLQAENRHILQELEILNYLADTVASAVSID